jgi:hypothetical protein
MSKKKTKKGEVAFYVTDKNCNTEDKEFGGLVHIKRTYSNNNTIDETLKEYIYRINNNWLVDLFLRIMFFVLFVGILVIGLHVLLFGCVK